MRLVALCVLSLLCACSSGAKITRGEGLGIAQVQALPANGDRYRIIVAPVLDKSIGNLDTSLASQIPLINVYYRSNVTALDITRSIQDMLITELFAVGPFIVLERDGLDALMAEQLFAAENNAATAVPAEQLEGAELILVAAITGFDPGITGGALPIPVPLGLDSSFGLARFGFKRGFVSMDMRLLDASTGRVLQTIAVEGRNTRLGFDFDVFADVGYRYATLPSAIQLFKNTPIEQALQEMVGKAVLDLAQSATKADNPP